MYACRRMRTLLLATFNLYRLLFCRSVDAAVAEEIFDFYSDFMVSASSVVICRFNELWNSILRLLPGELVTLGPERKAWLVKASYGFARRQKFSKCNP